jgi:hypothetical protein
MTNPDDAFRALENIANGADPNSEAINNFVAMFANSVKQMVDELMAAGFTGPQARAMVAAMFGWRQ